MTAFFPQTDIQTEQMNTSMEPYLEVFGKHQRDNWVMWVPLAEFAANNRTSDNTKWTPFYAAHRIDPRMSFTEEPTKDQDQR